MVQSELKYLIGAKIVNLKSRVFGGKTGPFPMVRVFRVVRPLATVRFQVERNPEPTREFWLFAYTTHHQSEACHQVHQDQWLLKTWKIGTSRWCLPPTGAIASGMFFVNEPSSGIFARVEIVKKVRAMLMT